MKSNPATQPERLAIIWRYIKLFVGVILFAVVLVFTSQNADPVAVRFLARRFELSLSLLMFFVLVTGIVVGTVVSGWVRWRRSHRRNA